MNCPACHQPLTEKEVVTTDGQKVVIHECFNCGGHFLPSLTANFIPQSTTLNLDSIAPKNDYPAGHELNCPYCQAVMINIKDDSVPRGVEIYACPENHGNFFPSHQLFAFKKAQETKLKYHELWGIPIKSIFAVLLPVFAIFTAVSLIPITIQQLQQNQESRTKASGVISQPLISPVSPDRVVISFTTATPSTVSITLTTAAGDRVFPGILTPQSTHVITLNELVPNTTYSYTVTVGNITAGPFTFTTLSQ